MRILAIDPGPTESAFVVYEAGSVVASAKVHNGEILSAIGRFDYDAMVVEKVESFGMAVGAEVFETVWWSGRFAEAADRLHSAHHRLPRKAVKLHLCHTNRANDANIRAALIDKFGGASAIGKRKTPGPLYGVKGDVWSALAVAVTFAETQLPAPAGGGGGGE